MKGAVAVYRASVCRGRMTPRQHEAHEEGKPARIAISRAAVATGSPKSAWAINRLHQDLLMVAFRQVQSGGSSWVSKQDAERLVRAAGGKFPKSLAAARRLLQRRMVPLRVLGLAIDCDGGRKIEVAINPGSYGEFCKGVDKPVAPNLSANHRNRSPQEQMKVANRLGKYGPTKRGRHAEGQARAAGRFAKKTAGTPPLPVPGGTDPVAAIPSAPAVPAAPEATPSPGDSFHSKAPEEKKLEQKHPDAPMRPQTGVDRVGPRRGPMRAPPSVPLAGTHSDSPKPPRLHLTAANLTAEERALLSPATLAMAAQQTAPWLANGFLRGSLEHARERVAAGLTPWELEPTQPDAGHDAACVPAGARTGPRAREAANGRTGHPGRPPRLRIKPLPLDDTPATPDWLRDNLARWPWLSDVAVRLDAFNGYPRAAWRQAVAVLIKQERSWVREPAAFVAKGAREIAAGGQHDPRKSSLYSVMRNWPRELAVFAQVESRMPGWEEQYGGRHFETEQDNGPHVLVP